MWINIFILFIGMGYVLGKETLAFLRHQPQFKHMKTLVQQNPALLPELLQQIGRSNPTLLQVFLNWNAIGMGSEAINSSSKRNYCIQKNLFTSQESSTPQEGLKFNQRQWSKFPELFQPKITQYSEAARKKTKYL